MKNSSSGQQIDWFLNRRSAPSRLGRNEFWGQNFLDHSNDPMIFFRSGGCRSQAKVCCGFWGFHIAAIIKHLHSPEICHHQNPTSNHPFCKPKGWWMDGFSMVFFQNQLPTIQLSNPEISSFFLCVLDGFFEV